MANDLLLFWRAEALITIMRIKKPILSVLIFAAIVGAHAMVFAPEARSADLLVHASGVPHSHGAQANHDQLREKNADKPVSLSCKTRRA